MSRLRSVQILRGIAATLVVVDHAILRQAEWVERSPLTHQIAMHTGALGVWVFFVVSGFIMVHTSYDRYGTPAASQKFLLNRLIRIVPIYWLATFLELALRTRHGAALDFEKVIYSLLFIPMPVEPGPMAAMRPTLGVGWTLNYEMFFYILFAASLLFTRRRGLTLLLAAMVALVAGGSLLKPLTDTREPITMLTFWSSPIILLFAFGVVIGIVEKHWTAPAWRLNYPLLLALLLALLAIDVGIFSALVATYPVPIGWQAAFWIIGALCVCVCVFVRTGRPTWLARPLVHLGDASYSLYLFHFFAVIAAEKLWWALDPTVAPWLFVPFATAIAIGAGIVVHHAVEMPIDRLLRPRKVAAARTLQDPQQKNLALIRTAQPSNPHVQNTGSAASQHQSTPGPQASIRTGQWSH